MQLSFMRFLMVPACVGAIVGAVIMFALAAAKLYGASMTLWKDGPSEASYVTAAVMGATDAFLFAVVLVVFACAIAVGFVLPKELTTHPGTPEWMKFHGLGSLKKTLIEVIIVYLVVDFTTDLATASDALQPAILAKPAGIFLIALTLWLMSRARHER